MTRKLKLAIYRPHDSLWFRDPVANILRGNRLPNKYALLFDHLLESGHRISLTAALPADGGVKARIRSWMDPIELVAWCVLNKVSLRRVNLVFRQSGLSQQDVVLAMHYGNFAHESTALTQRLHGRASVLAGISALKVVHLTHYAYNAVLGAQNLTLLKPDLLVAESDLASNSGFFARHYGAVSAPFAVLPYTPQARFVDKMPFDERLNRIVVTGSITYKMRDAAFVEFYGVDELQPLRRALFERAPEFRAEMDCLISDLNASRAAVAPRRWWRKITDRVQAKHPQLAYYRKDIVATYNEYRMFAVPEEVCDLPAIGFVEGMACGCAYFGIDSPMYRDIGMLPGVHYVAHDGSVEGLMLQVRRYQADGAALKAIARQGQAFVRERLNPEAVYAAFLRRVELAFLTRSRTDA